MFTVSFPIDIDGDIARSSITFDNLDDALRFARSLSDSKYCSVYNNNAHGSDRLIPHLPA